MIKWNLETLSIKSLQQHPKNPRQIHKEQMQKLEELIDTFGLIDKPIVNKDNTIIGGHQRIKILKKKKVKEVECWVPDRQLTDEEVEHLMIGHNLNQGSWDYDLLANNFDANDLLSWGFSQDQLFGLFDDSIKDVEEKSSAKKKQKECPNCGHEF